MKKKKIAVLGAGKLGEALISGLLAAKIARREQFVVTAAHRERLTELERRLGIRTTLANDAAVRGADIVLICVKPQTVEEVLTGIKNVLTEKHLLISVAASVTTRFMESVLASPIPVIRTMPNTPCLIRQGMTALAPGSFATSEHLQIARTIFDAIGRTVILDEKHMDAVTALSASGPAYMYIVFESLAEAGVKVGLPRHIATELAAQMALGAAQMVLQTGEHPAKLKDGVTTPSGCTIDGILELEEGGLRVTLIKAVVRATERARQLVNG